jgi:hypothetical protein
MSVRYLPTSLAVTHPALSEMQFLDGTPLANETLSGKYELSFEMVMFLIRYAGGVWTGTQTDLRCHKIATRKGAYKDVLINKFDMLTEEGIEAVQDARIIRFMVDAYKSQHQLPLIKDDLSGVKTMEDIIPYGRVPLYSFKLYRLLWDALPADLKGNFGALQGPPSNWRLPIFLIDNKPTIPIANVKNNMYLRLASETLIKFGLVDLVFLPKDDYKPGKGRRPLGFQLNETGLKFYHNYLETFDVKTKHDIVAKKKIQAYIADSAYPEDADKFEMPKPKLTAMSDLSDSTSSDVVDGEDLRELFGG